MVAAVRLMEEICAQPAMRALLRRAVHGPGRRLRRRPARPRRPHHLPDLPPGRHLRDRLGRRRRPAGAGPGGHPRRRRLGDADRPARQHQRADDRDRRARRRPDQGRGAAANRRRRDRLSGGEHPRLDAAGGVGPLRATVEADQGGAGVAGGKRDQRVEDRCAGQAALVEQAERLAVGPGLRAGSGRPPSRNWSR